MRRRTYLNIFTSSKTLYIRLRKVNVCLEYILVPIVRWNPAYDVVAYNICLQHKLAINSVSYTHLDVSKRQFQQIYSLRYIGREP